MDKQTTIALWHALAAAVNDRQNNHDPDAPLPAPRSQTEVIISFEARIGGMRAQHAMHGYTHAGIDPRHLGDELQHLVATLLAAIPPARRAAVVKELRKKRIRRDEPDEKRAADAKKLIAAAHRRTDITFKLTPTWKPRR